MVAAPRARARAISVTMTMRFDGAGGPEGALVGEAVEGVEGVGEREGAGDGFQCGVHLVAGDEQSAQQ